MASKPPSPATSLPPASTAAARGDFWKRWLFDYGPVLVLMAMIFVASTSVGTAQHSGWLLRHLLDWLGVGPHLAPAQFETVNHYVRKMGHLVEYALLGGLLHRAMTARYRTAGAGAARWAPFRVLAVVALVALYAASDEFHQVFVATRTPAVPDAMLDTVGGALGLGVKWGWEQWRRRSSG